MRETLLTGEELVVLEDLSAYYRVPADNRASGALLAGVRGGGAGLHPVIAVL